MVAEKAAVPFRPEDHFRNLKGQMYLETKYRIVWFREEHADGYIRTDLVHFDLAHEQGLFIFKAQVGYVREDGREVYATGYGSETVKDFRDACEKAETKAVGRALAMLGYGTAQAIELDEGERAPTDSPVERRPAQPPAPSHSGLAVVPPAPQEMAELRKELTQWFAQYPDAKQAADALLAKEGKREHGPNRIREMVGRLRKRAADEEAAISGNTTEQLAQAVESGRRLLVTVAGRPREQPIKGDVIAARTILKEIQRCEPLADDLAVDGLEDKEVVPALSTRILVANQQQRGHAAVADADEDLEDIPL